MKKNYSSLLPGLLPVCLALSGLSLTAHAADYSPYPAAGVYEASDSKFERVLTIKPNGKFTLEVEEKGKPGNLHTGAGEGQLSDAPGGWNFSEGRCTMNLKRAAGGMKMQVEACAGAWGDVPFDGLYKKTGELPAAQPAKAAMPAAQPAPAQKAMVAATPAAAATPTSAAAPALAANSLPSRKEIKTTWQAISVDEINKKGVMFIAKDIENKSSTPNPIEQFSRAAFVIDTSIDYEKMSAAELAKFPLQLIEVPLPAVGPKEGLEFKSDCIYGKSDKVIVINRTGSPTIKRLAAWMMDKNLKLVEIKQINKVNCTSPFY